MGLFGAAQAVAAGLAGLIATGTLDVTRAVLPTPPPTAVVFGMRPCCSWLAAALVAARLLHARAGPAAPTLQPGE